MRQDTIAESAKHPEQTVSLTEITPQKITHEAHPTLVHFEKTAV